MKMKQINFCHCLQYTYLTTVSALFHSLNYLILETVVFLHVDWPCSPFLVASASLGYKIVFKYASVIWCAHIENVQAPLTLVLNLRLPFLVTACS